ncbi:SMODS domain-containing nucleotidyltransferase [Shewanella frigidimarina]|uniref:SMODS domain-containing nucleotidyltransferase n=1 Tax=Shewanella frigidimarina TaxID=56812 RepID=UPI000F4F0387|nr:nucleotidyltransferase [Shewanella frigidimarina]RPA22901.1 nucleotidyltransferase [Shewanella frigidimarina]
MTVRRDFSVFLDNLKIKNKETISSRYGSITKNLNEEFRGLENDKTNYSLQAGSYGRYSGVQGISDLDMLYILPPSAWATYRKDPSKALDHAKDAIKKTYKTSKVKKDRNVVVVEMQDFTFEVVPVFEWQGVFKYPDTYNGGSWRKCNTRAELRAFRELNNERKDNLRKLAKMVRAWKARNDIQMSGFLIDTLCYNFFKNNTQYDNASFGNFDEMVRYFFQYLTKEPKKAFYYAFGSNTQVGVKKTFQADAQTALDNANEAIEARKNGYEDKCNQRYKAIFGTKFPNREAKQASAVNEQFIEELFDMDITNQIVIDCEVKSDLMTKMLSSIKFVGERIQHQRKLHFCVRQTDIIEDYEVKWKVRNHGYMADKDKQYRGEIMDDDGSKIRVETATFYGDHTVECYAIRNNTVIARHEITVPIE